MHSIFYCFRKRLSLCKQVVWLQSFQVSERQEYAKKGTYDGKKILTYSSIFVVTNLGILHSYDNQLFHP